MILISLLLVASPVAADSFDPCVVGAQKAFVGTWKTSAFRRGGTVIAPQQVSGVTVGSWIEPYTLVLKITENGKTTVMRETLVKEGLALEIDDQPVVTVPVKWKCAYDGKTKTYVLEMRYPRPIGKERLPFFNLIESSEKGSVLERHRVRPDGSLEWHSTDLAVPQ